MSHVPFSVRRGKREVLTHQDGVPLHLKSALVGWVQRFTLDAYGGVNSEALLTLISRLQWPIHERDVTQRFVKVHALIESDDECFLDALDLLCTRATAGQRRALDEILENGLSRYRVRRIEPYGLEERLGDETRSSLALAASVDDDAAEHIKQAWVEAYGRDTDATRAWHSAIKAVESLLKPIVEPKNSLATLGSMKSALRGKPEKWTFALTKQDGDNSAQLFIQVLEIIGYEPGRHGTDPDRATIEQARVVVLQAVTIVEWLRAGALKRADG